MKQAKFNNAHGTIVAGKTPPGRLAVKFDDEALGTKAIRIKNIAGVTAENEEEKPKSVGTYNLAVIPSYATSSKQERSIA